MKTKLRKKKVNLESKCKCSSNLVKGREGKLRNNMLPRFLLDLGLKFQFVYFLRFTIVDGKRELPFQCGSYIPEINA